MVLIIQLFSINFGRKLSEKKSEDSLTVWLLEEGRVEIRLATTALIYSAWRVVNPRCKVIYTRNIYNGHRHVNSSLGR